mgnify:CR=1 FL=1
MIVEDGLVKQNRSGTWCVVNQSSGTNLYQVNPMESTCTCVDWQLHKHCKHLDAVQIVLNDEAQHDSLHGGDVLDSLVFLNVIQIGLPNLGQTCWLNSLIIGLFQLTSIQEMLQRDPPVPTPHLWNELVDVYLTLQAGLGVLESVTNFHQLIQSQFPCHQQHDSEEFLRAISHLFPQLHGTLQISWSCYACGQNGSSEPESFCALGLDVSAVDLLFEHIVTTQELVQQLETQQTPVECSQHGQGYTKEQSQHVQLLTLPEILVLHLKHFTYSDGKLLKLHTPIELSPHLQVHHKNYELKTSICHQGTSLEVGHYICNAYFQHPNQEEKEVFTLSFSDTTVTKYDYFYSNHSTPYLAFYQELK